MPIGELLKEAIWFNGKIHELPHKCDVVRHAVRKKSQRIMVICIHIIDFKL